MDDYLTGSLIPKKTDRIGFRLNSGMLAQSALFINTMMLPHYFETLLQLLVDGLFASAPRRRPDKAALQNCRIVSHRGEHDNKIVLENTLVAFDLVLNDGVWGIEFDIRWTLDLQPVVIHDSDCQRVFGSPIEINKITLQSLQSEVPQIPSLQRVVDHFGKKLHLMIEIKEEPFSDINLQCSRLSAILSNLTPGEDFHLLALKPSLFKLFNIVPNSAMLPVAELNLKTISRQAIDRNFAGICGHYLLLSSKLIKKFQHRSQKIGSGFARSRFSFYRELNRGVEWIFTNHAIKLNHIRNKLLEKYQS